MANQQFTNTRSCFNSINYFTNQCSHRYVEAAKALNELIWKHWTGQITIRTICKLEPNWENQTNIMHKSNPRSEEAHIRDDAHVGRRAPGGPWPSESTGAAIVTSPLLIADGVISCSFRVPLLSIRLL